MMHDLSGLQAGHLSSQSYYSIVLLQYVQNVNDITVLEDTKQSQKEGTTCVAVNV